MGVEFKLGRQDHRKVEDFLARRPTGVTAITIDAHRLRLQVGAAEAAHALGLDVHVEPLTERLTEVGFEPDGLAYYAGAPIDVSRLRRDALARRVFVEQVHEAQHEVATRAVAPHFLIDGRDALALNVELAHETVMIADKPVRAIVLVKRKFAIATAEEMASAYAAAGVASVDLRITPFGGEDEGMQKIRSVFDIADRFRGAGITVVLGHSGNIGQVALALGHIHSFSVGIGMGERVDHATAINRQTRPSDDEDAVHFGAQARVYLPDPSVLVDRRHAHAMLQNREIRSRISCRIGTCGDDIAGPASDPREHYLHSRAAQVASLLGRPSAWRLNIELDRLQRALDLREIINRGHLPDGAHPLKTRTLRSLLEDIEFEQRMSA